jgi:hypothetical protein
MKPETLQALLLDRALGELPPETVELVDAYLVQNPQAAPLAEELAFTLQQTHRAVAVATKPELPPLALADPDVATARQRGWGVVWFHEWGRLAACLAAGAAIGWSAHLLQTERNEPVVPSGAAAPQLALRTELPSPRANPGFWSIDAVLAARAKPRPSPHYRLRWTSLGSKPVVEEIP